jgi:hypothetical protein
LLPFFEHYNWGTNVIPQSLWHYDTLTLSYMTSQQNIQSPPS